jgi:hypothetical protein
LSNVQGATVSYALWFFVRKGHANDKFTVEIGNDSVGWATIQTINTADLDSTLPGLEQRVRWIRQRVKVPNSTPHFTSGQKLRFTATRHEDSGGTVEACVDEVRVWGVYSQ